MRKTGVICILLIASAAAARAEDCQLKKYGTIPFETDGMSHIFIPASIQDRKTRLQLDTGAFWSMVRRDLAEELQLKIRRSYYLNLVDLAGEKLKDVAVVPVLKLGNMKYGETEMFVTNMAASTPVEQFGGLLGQNLLNKLDLEIDNAGKTISLFSQDHCKGAGVYWADEAVTLEYYRKPGTTSKNSNIKSINTEQIDPPIVKADVEGQTAYVLFDTGATYSSMDLDVARVRFGITPQTPGVEPDGKAYTASGASIDSYKYTIKSLTISGIRFENVPIRLSKFDDKSQILLGMNELKHLRIYFSFGEGLVHITAADAKREAAPQQK
ncbi:MAG: aspartyl protease family protein [Alphaproteobacteria bacterium]|nr:aspartyl protease family protein [Alphaproteobacteria bacterium]